MRLPRFLLLFLLLAIALRPARAAEPPADLAGPLLAAVAAGDSGRVAELLAAGADPDTAQKFRVRALMLAAGRGDLASARLLLAAGAAADARSSWGESALHHAARAGSGEIVGLLLTAGADPRARAKAGRTPLYVAAAGGAADCVRLLLAAGADPAATVAEGETPLHAAARGGHLPVVEQLLAAGAPLAARDRSGRDAFGAAVAAGANDAAARLATALAAAGLAADPVPLRPAATDVSGVDWEDRAYPLRGCTVELTAGRSRTAGGPCAVSAIEVLIGDLTGDGARDAVVLLHLGSGAAGSVAVLLFTFADGGARELARLPADAPPGLPVVRARLDGGVLELELAGEGGDTRPERWRWEAAGSRLVRLDR